jgi:hypothetical protein
MIRKRAQGSGRFEKMDAQELAEATAPYREMAIEK